MIKTKVIKAKEVDRKWHLIDLNDQVLGRVATQIANLLMGKNKPTYTPTLDNGDYVVVTNAAAIVVTRNKMAGKIYRHHTGFPGGFREATLEELMAKDPRKVIEKAVAGMLPKNKLRAPRLKRLKIYVNNQHPYQNKFAKMEK